MHELGSTGVDIVMHIVSYMEVCYCVIIKKTNEPVSSNELPGAP